MEMDAFQKYLQSVDLTSERLTEPDGVDRHDLMIAAVVYLARAIKDLEDNEPSAALQIRSIVVDILSGPKGQTAGVEKTDSASAGGASSEE